MSSDQRFALAVRALAGFSLVAALFGCSGPGPVSNTVAPGPLGALDGPAAAKPEAMPLHATAANPIGDYVLEGEYGAEGDWAPDDEYVPEDPYFPEDEYVPEDAPPESPGVGHRLLYWLPNRVFDVLDLARARVRVGPGWTFSIRVTELADINMGAHRAFFVGLRGPRHEPMVPWPFGLERFEGVEVSVMDMTSAEEDRGPRYDPLEVGLGFQFLVIGADVGVALWEAVDLLAGVFLFDPVGDDF